MNNKQKDLWEISYLNKDNFVFYPHEEIIRFVSKYIRKRLDFDKFLNIVSYNAPPKILDLGCGIGRHIIYLSEMGLDPYGIDLSNQAIKSAIKWAKLNKIQEAEKKIKQGDICYLPWSKGFFDFVVSHGVLDSMHFEIARNAMEETHRVLKKDGLIYCDLISGDDSEHYREYCGEEIVSTDHENGTIQSYFNYEKIGLLIDGLFEIIEAFLIRKESIVYRKYVSRYHLVLKRI